MPMPTPNNDEDKQEFIERCMGTGVMKDEFPENSQRLAVCNAQWKKDKNERQPIMERRFFAPETIEVRANEGESPKIAGYSAVFGQETRVGPFVEKIAQGAFSDSIEEDDIRALFNHDANYVLGRNSSGTLDLKEDKTGLFMETEPPGTQWANDLLVSIERGDITGQSFGFQVMEDEWETKEIDGDPVEHRTIKKARLIDVGPVTWPAYLQTDVAVRSAQEVYAEHRDEDYETPDSAGAESEEVEPERQGPSEAYLKRERIITLSELKE